MWALSGNGTADSPYTISSEADLQKFANIVNGTNGEKRNTAACAKLMTNITLSGAWTPMGTSSNAYTGTFDGNGKTISGLSITATAANAGLFGCVNGATIKNFTLAGTLSSGYDNTGSVVGYAKGSSTIQDIVSSVNITMTAVKSHLGGIAGNIENSTSVLGCTYTGTLDVGESKDSNGGIVGFANANCSGKIQYCFCSGTIKTTASTPVMGGILGYTNDESNNFGGVQDCYSCATLTYGGSNANYVNAIVGRIRAHATTTINNTYLSGTATRACNTDGPSITTSNKDITITLTVATFEDLVCGTITQSYINPTSTTPTQLKAVVNPKFGFEFSYWKYGSTDQTRILPLTASISDMAFFDRRKYTIEVFTNNANYGQVSIEGGTAKDYEKRTSYYMASLILFAYPKSGYHLQKWSDGSTDRIHKIKVAGNAAYTATFIPHPYGDWIVEKEATCYEDGLMCRVCTYDGCDAKETKNIPHISHNFQPEKRDDGSDFWSWADYYRASLMMSCTQCKEQKFLVVEENDIVQSWDPAPTCTTGGVRVYTATVTFEGKTYQSTKTKTVSPQHQWEDMRCTLCGKEAEVKGYYSHGTSGTCKWSVYESGDLIIEPINGVSGELGTWKDYAPWISNGVNSDIINVRFKGEVIAQTCYGMFYRCWRMENIDLTGLNTEKVTDMEAMFWECSSLQAIDLSCLNTENVTNMRDLFFYCSSLQNIDLTGLNTEKVSSMNYMFADCSSLKSLDISSLSMKSVSSYALMFRSCKNLESLTLSDDFIQNTGNNQYNMFIGCGKDVDGGCTIYGVTDVNLKDRLFVNTSPDYIHFVDNTAAIRDGKNMLITKATTYPADMVKLERTFTVAKPATLMLPFKVPASQIGTAEFYEFKGVTYDEEKSEWIATLQDVAGDVEAYKPYVVKTHAARITFGTSEQSITFPITPEQSDMTTTDAATGWTFIGLNDAKNWAANDEEIGKAYGFAGKSKDVNGVQVAQGEFVKIAAGASAKPGRCYLVKEGKLVANAKGMARAAATEDLPATIKVRFVNANDETTGIAELNTETGEFSTVQWYDLNGRKIDQPTKGGIYIKNNKKVLVK